MVRQVLGAGVVVVFASLLGIVGLSDQISAQTQGNQAEAAPDQADLPDPGASLDDVSLKEEEPLAFKYLPKTKIGYVDWVEAIKQGIIKPKESLDPNAAAMRPLDFDIIFKVKGDLPDVVYPHYPHTIWLDCRNCHPGVFLMKAGSNPVTMAKILQGEFCGRCHGTVAFPVSDCFRCHSRPK